VNAGAVVREAAGEAAAVAHGHGLTVDVQPGAPLVVEAPGDELHRLVLNLIQNALVHTPPGTAVDVRARREGDDVLLEVSDEGPGIPEEMRAHIFDRFVRGNGDRAGSNGTGSGLGLSIVRAVTDSLGGSVTVGESDSGGARFTVRIPAAGAKREDVPSPPQPASQPL
jgi:two-component system OmpR family sensor kinase